MTKKDDSLIRVFDKLICLAVVVPPLYMLIRFLRWYIRQEREVVEEEAAS